MNRTESDFNRIKTISQVPRLEPSSTSSGFKDTGNGPERATAVLTMFNPCDHTYNLNKHFGVDLKPFKDSSSPLYGKGYRSLHLIMNRNGEGGKQFPLLFNGMIRKFDKY